MKTHKNLDVWNKAVEYNSIKNTEFIDKTIKFILKSLITNNKL